MSPPRAVSLKPAARRDVRSILLYTGEQWGNAQRDAYLTEINQVLAAVGANPRIGRVREEIMPGLRSIAVEQHVIYYRIDARTVTVLRILHSKMESTPHLLQ